ncbi:MAG: response regulator [Bernardetiaceae bacterium]
MKAYFQTLAGKLIVGFALILTLSIGVNIFAILRLQQVQDVALRISENWMPSLYTLANLNAGNFDLMLQEQQHIFELSEVKMQTYEQRIERLRTQTEQEAQRYTDLLRLRGDDPDNQPLLQKYIQTNGQFLAAADSVLMISKDNNKYMALQELQLKVFPPFSEANRQISQLLERDQKLGVQAAEQSKRIYTTSTWLIGAMSFISLIMSAFIAGLIISTVRKQVGGEPAEIAEITRRVSQGDLNIAFSEKGQTGIYASIQSLVEQLRAITQLANKIAQGDLSQNVKPRSSDDELALAINQMIQNFKEIIAQARLIATGDYSINIRRRGAHDELGAALQAMALNLRQSKTDTEAQNWLKDGINELGQKLSGQLSFREISQKAVGFLARYINAGQGVLYIFDPDHNDLKLYGTYAFTERNSLSNRYVLGQGIIGQVALEQSPILLKNIHRDERAIQTGTLDEAPLNSFAFPLLFENELQGVIELSSFEPFTDVQRDFLLQASQMIATYLSSVRQTERIKGLLAISEEATRNAETRAQEIEAANTQLEEQRHKLQQQSEELRQRNQSLIQAKEELDRRADELEISNRYKSEFLANMSHELRTPLNSIIMLSKMLAKNDAKNLIEKDVKKAQIINKSGEELLRLINDILDLSKIEAGRMALHTTEFTPKSLLDEMHDLFHGIAQEKKIKFNVIDELNQPLKTDRDRLSQIIRNFLSNAFKFTPKGQVTLAIKPYADDPQKIAISVSDTGIGIPEDKQQEVFEAFKQVDGSVSREFGGTGLGLSIARELSRLLQGEIVLESNPGKGSTFTLIIAREIDQTLLDADGVPVFIKKQTGQAQHVQLVHVSPPSSGIRREIADDRQKLQEKDRVILIVEDEAKFAEGMAEVIREENFKVIIAQNAQEGIELAKRYQPNGIMLDLGLPDVQGNDALERFKAVKEIRHIPIEVVSAQDKDLTVLKRGAIGFLQKPVHEKDLKNAIAEIRALSEKKIKDLLIVEDDEVQLAHITKLLAGDDVRVKGVKSRALAIQALQERRYDGAIIDLALTDGDGYEVCKYIQSRFPKVATIVYTAKNLSPEEERKIRQATQSILLKSQSSEAELQDEVALFLHRMGKEVKREVQVKEQIKEQAQQAQERSSSKARLEAKVRELEAQKQQQEQGKATDLAAQGQRGNDQESRQKIKDKQILVVDDDIRNIFVIASALENFEAVILEALNGNEALRVLDEEQVSLVMMDSVMPEMDGLEAMRQIRANPRTRDLPIIAITGKVQPEDQQACLEAGANDFISKPVDYDELLQKVCRWIR